MAYRNIFVANQSTMKLKNNQLIVNNGEEFSFPIEDIRSIVIDNCYTTLSGKLLSKLVGEGVCVIVCDEKHNPSVQLLPICSYCRMNKRISLQFTQSQPKLKRIWQSIVVAKINNQAQCLSLNNFETESKQLLSIAKKRILRRCFKQRGLCSKIVF